MRKALLRWYLGSVPPVSTAHASGERRGLPPRRGGVSELYDWEGYTASVSMGQTVTIRRSVSSMLETMAAAMITCV
jgi:hypothetical protein